MRPLLCLTMLVRTRGFVLGRLSGTVRMASSSDGLVSDAEMQVMRTYEAQIKDLLESAKLREQTWEEKKRRWMKTETVSSTVRMSSSSDDLVSDAVMQVMRTYEAQIKDLRDSWEEKERRWGRLSGTVRMASSSDDLVGDAIMHVMRTYEAQIKELRESAKLREQSWEEKERQWIKTIKTETVASSSDDLVSDAVMQVIRTYEAQIKDLRDSAKLREQTWEEKERLWMKTKTVSKILHCHMP